MPGDTWSDAELAELRTQIAQKSDPKDVVITGRSPGAIRNQAVRMKLIGDKVPRAVWPDANKRALIRLIAEGWTAKRIAEAPRVLVGYNRNAIAKQMQRLKLGDARNRAKAKAAKRLPQEVLTPFYDFLRANVAQHPPEELALMWNADHETKVTVGRVRRHLTSLGINLPRSAVMKLPFSKKKRAKSSHKALAALKKRHASYQADLLARLETRAAAIRGGKTRFVEQVCCEADCQRSWPRKPEFFYMHSEQVDRGYRYRYSPRCQLCAYRRRKANKKSKV